MNHDPQNHGHQHSPPRADAIPEGRYLAYGRSLACNAFAPHGPGQASVEVVVKCAKTGKVGHKTREAAIVARKKAGHILSGYRCGHCKLWHLGNTGNTRLANMNRLFDKVHARESSTPPTNKDEVR